ncbi:MFS transporter [Longispora sp. NPDC051575]|uniref:MFS transporter n=1 Tax=Longispora sp. NPDC051575 TaxID=3154943 RepID=UPI0034337906
MTTEDTLAAAPHPGGGRPRPGHRALIGGLAVTQTVGYGVLFYAFAVLLAPMGTGLGASVTQVTGALTLAVLVSAATAIPVGRWLDRHGGRWLMTSGSVLATAAVVAWSQVRTVVELYAVFAVLGVAAAMVQYEAAFAVIIQTVRASRRASSMLAVTVVAGFASSIFLPLTGVLTAHLHWRTAILVLAGVHGLLTVPIHALVVPAAGRTGQRAPAASGAVRLALRDRGFWLLVVGFSLQGAAMTTVAVHLVAYLTRLGHPVVFATTTAGLLGVLSVTGRVLTTGLRRYGSTAAIAAAVFVLQAGAVAALPVLGGSPAGAVGCVVAFGLGFGIASVTRPALNADRYPTSAYASISGAQNLPVVLAKASAPLAAAAVLTASTSYTPVMVGTAVACLLAAACLLALDRARVTAAP